MAPELSPTERESGESFAERITTIQRSGLIRDAKQAEIFRLMANSDNKGKILTDAWLELEIAQRELNSLVKDEIERRLSTI